MAVSLAKALADAGRQAVVVNADASQVYADLAILSARPDDKEMAGVPHRLFGHVDGAEAHNAARWADEAREVIYGMPYGEWKAKHQKGASTDQLATFGKARQRTG